MKKNIIKTASISLLLSMTLSGGTPEVAGMRQSVFSSQEIGKRLSNLHRRKGDEDAKAVFESLATLTSDSNFFSDAVKIFADNGNNKAKILQTICSQNGMYGNPNVQNVIVKNITRIIGDYRAEIVAAARRLEEMKDVENKRKAEEDKVAEQREKESAEAAKKRALEIQKRVDLYRAEPDKAKEEDKNAFGDFVEREGAFETECAVPGKLNGKTEAEKQKLALIYAVAPKEMTVEEFLKLIDRLGGEDLSLLYGILGQAKKEKSDGNDVLEKRFMEESKNEKPSLISIISTSRSGGVIVENEYTLKKDGLEGFDVFPGDSPTDPDIPLTFEHVFEAGKFVMKFKDNHNAFASTELSHKLEEYTETCKKKPETIAIHKDPDKKAPIRKSTKTWDGFDDCKIVLRKRERADIDEYERVLSNKDAKWVLIGEVPKDNHEDSRYDGTIMLQNGDGTWMRVPKWIPPIDGNGKNLTPNDKKMTASEAMNTDAKIFETMEPAKALEISDAVVEVLTPEQLVAIMDKLNQLQSSWITDEQIAGIFDYLRKAMKGSLTNDQKKNYVQRLPERMVKIINAEILKETFEYLSIEQLKWLTINAATSELAVKIASYGNEERKKLISKLPPAFLVLLLDELEKGNTTGSHMAGGGPPPPPVTVAGPAHENDEKTFSFDLLQDQPRLKTKQLSDINLKLKEEILDSLLASDRLIEANNGELSYINDELRKKEAELIEATEKHKNLDSQMTSSTSSTIVAEVTASSTAVQQKKTEIAKLKEEITAPVSTHIAATVASLNDDRVRKLMKTDDFTKKCPELVAILLGIGNNYTLIEQCDGGKLLDKIMNYYANSAENMQKRFYPNLRAIVIQPLAKRGYIGKLKNITNLFRPEQSSRIDLDSEINRGMYCYPNEQLDDWVWLITTLYASKGKQLSEAKEKNNEKIRKQKYNLLKKKFGDEADSYDVYVIVGSDTAADKRKLIKVADVNGQYADLALMFEMKVNAPVTERLWDYVRSAQNVDEQTVYVPIQGFPYSVKKNSNNNCELLPTGNDGAAFSPYKTCRTKTGADEDTILNNVVQSTFGSLIGILNSNQQQGKKLLQNGRRYTDGNNMSVNFSANGRTVVEKMLDVPNGDRGSMTIVAGINASDKLKKGTTEVNDDMNVLLQKEDAKFTQKPIFMENFMSTGVISTVVALPVTPKRTIQELTEAQLCILIQAYASVENKTKNFTLVPTWTAIKVETAQKHKYIDAKRNNRITNSKDAFPSFDLLANAVARDIPLLKQLLDGSLDKDKSFAYPNGGPAFGFLKDKDVVNNQDVQFWQLLSKIEQNAASTYQKGPVQFAKGDQKLWLYYVGNKSKAEPTQYQQIPLKNVPVSANCLRQIYNKCILDTQSLDPKKKTNATNILSELLQHNGVLWNYKSMNLLHYLLRIDNENSGTVQLAAIMQVEKCLSPDIEKKINGEHLTIDWLKKNLSALDAEFGYPAGITSIGVKNVALEDATSQSKTPGARTPPPAPVNTPDTKPSPVNDEKEPYNPIAKLRKVSPEEKSYEKQATKDRIELEELLGDSAAKASNIAKGIGEKIVAVVNNNSTNARHEHDRPRLKNTYQKLIANPLTLDTADLLQLKDILLKTIFPTSDFSTSKDDLMTTNLFGVYNTGSSALSSYVKFRKPFKNLEIPYVTTHQQKKDEIDEMLGKLQKHISTLIRSSELKDGGAALVLSAILDLVCTGKMVGNDIYCPDEDEGSAPFGMTGEIASVISRIMSNNVAEAE